MKKWIIKTKVEPAEVFLALIGTNYPSRDFYTTPIFNTKIEAFTWILNNTKIETIHNFCSKIVCVNKRGNYYYIMKGKK